MEINNIYNIDCNKGMSKMIKENIKVNLIVADPPYVISKKSQFHTMKDRKNPRNGTDFGEWDKEFNNKPWIKKSNKGYTLNDNIQNLVIPLNSIGTGKSDTLRLKDFCRDILENIPHNYLNLIDLAYDSKSNRQFEMEVVDLLVSECGYKGLHLGGGRKPDGIIYTENLKENYGTIIDTKAYSKGYSLPISQADEMRRYIEENNKRDNKINPNKWWENFPKLLRKFSFLFVSSEFNGQFEDKLENISTTTGINGAAINVVNLLLFAENIKSEFIGLEQAYQLMTQNSEIKLIDA